MPPRLPLPLTLRLLRPRALPTLRLPPAPPARALTTTPALLRIRKDPTLRRGAVDEHTLFTLDENIPAPGPEQLVLYIDPAGDSQGLRPLPELLSHLDRRNFHLHCINPQASGEPYSEPFIVRLVPREHIQARVTKALEAEAVARQKKRAPENVLKEIEFTWAISEHDLGHRMKKVRQFMEKGYRVDITIGVKKKMKKQTREHMVELLEKLEKKLKQWGREVREPEGELGRTMVLAWIGNGMPEGGAEKKKGLVEKEKEYEEELAREEAEARGEVEGVVDVGGEKVPEGMEGTVVVDQEGKAVEPEVVDMEELRKRGEF